MAKDVQLTQADRIDAADAAVRRTQQALVNLKGKLAAVHGSIDPAAAYEAQAAARSAQVAAAEIVDALRPLVIEAQAAEAAAELLST